MKVGVFNRICLNNEVKLIMDVLVCLFRGFYNSCCERTDGGWEGKKSG